MRDADAERLRLAHADAHAAELREAARVAAETNPTAVPPDWSDPAVADPSIDLWPGPGEPWEVAQGLLLRDWTDRDTGLFTLRRWRGQWREWTGAHWAEIEAAAMRARLYGALAEAVCECDGKTVPWSPSRARIDGVLDALAAAAHLDAAVEPGGWIGGGGPRLIPTTSGMLDPRARVELDSTPAYFNLHALPIRFDAAAKCPAWHEFLSSVWPDDAESVRLLQQWMGYLVSGRTDLQKGLLMVGPRRSGKGTILSVATALVGDAATAPVTLANLSERFGLMPLLGAGLATIGDARLEGRTATLVERLLSLIGGDRLTVDRKGRDPVSFSSAARFMIASNLPPRLHDPSGAIGSRFVVLPFAQSFLGREDLGLAGRLEAELPGILCWALDGLADLELSGRLTDPRTAGPIRHAFDTMASPITQFIDDACVIDTGATVAKAKLYVRYRTWCETAGHRPAGDAQFAAELMSLGLGISSSRPRVGARREYTFTGIRIADAL
ncbi:DNA primase family protein [Tsukamurella tyrosinosolvens]|uniref:DNA primase family protein n=1 Tax=Tsukamurella tyrosinosolvens TaxID=57704 RepID=UPI002DD44AFE|nr:phage/plasmid primase, P4 family [Tsukamurella tyrosinosolvens]MEC4614023.1 phage/plasmid primase, P4 family [Tsukamurella tyrosinosolvens]